MVWLVGHVLTVVMEDTPEYNVKYIRKLFKKYGKKVIKDNLEKIGFKNIKFEFNRGTGNNEIVSAYNIYATYKNYDINYKYDYLKDYIDYVIEPKSEDKIKIYRGAGGFFKDISDKEWYVKT